jgi:putative ABC transport system substrate-binding protein
MGGKWLGLLKEIAPRLKHAGALFSADAAPHASFLRAAEAVGPVLGVTVSIIDLRKRDEMEPAIAALAREPDAGLLVFPHPITIANRAAINALAARYRLPAIYAYRYFCHRRRPYFLWSGSDRPVARMLRGASIAS